MYATKVGPNVYWINKNVSLENAKPVPSTDKSRCVKIRFPFEVQEQIEMVNEIISCCWKPANVPLTITKPFSSLLALKYLKLQVFFLHFFI